MAQSVAVLKEKQAQARVDAMLAQAKGGLARLLATENLTVIHDPSAKTAAFELQKRMLILPVWTGISADLYDLLVGHEVGHALYTDEKQWMGTMERLALKHYKKAAKRAMPFIKGILNVLEDPRIETKMKWKYPGLRRSFITGYAELWERDFFGVKDKVAATAFSPAQAMLLPFMDRLNIYAKVGAGVGIYFTQTELPFVERAVSLTTWDELEQLADDLIAYMRENAKEPQTGDGEGEGGDGDSDGEEQADGRKGKKKDKKKSEKDKSEDSGEGDAEEEENADGEKSEQSQKSEDGSEDGDGEGDEGEGEESESESDADGEGDEGEGEESESESDADGEGDEGEGEGEGDAEGGDEEEESDSDGESETETDPASDAEPNKPGKTNNVAQRDLPEEDDDEDLTEEQIAQELGDAASDKTFQERAKSLAQNGVQWARFTMPTPNLDKIVHDYKRVMTDHATDVAHRLKLGERSLKVNGGTDNENSEQTFYDRQVEWVNKFRRTEQKNIAYMLKEFEMWKAADSHARVQSAKTGRLDMNKLHSYQYNEDIFRRSLIQHKGQSHGIVFILDFSGSMTDCIREVTASLISMAMFCRQAKIPFDVYIFTDNLFTPGHGSSPLRQRNTGRNGSFNVTDGTDVELASFWLRNLLSSRMSVRDFNQAVINLRLLSLGRMFSDRMGGTPLIGSIYVARDVVARFKDANKLDVVTLMVMTDGDSNMLENSADASLYNNLSNNYGKPGYVVWHDKRTKKDIVSKKFDALYPQNITLAAQTLFLSDMKKTLGINTVGYFIAPKGNYGTTYVNKFSSVPAENHKAIEDYKKNGWTGVTSHGYDEYYIVSKELLQGNQETFAASTATTENPKDVTKALKAFTENKNNARQILKSIVRRICKQ